MGPILTLWGPTYSSDGYMLSGSTIQGPGRQRTAPGESSGPARPNYASIVSSLGINNVKRPPKTSVLCRSKERRTTTTFSMEVFDNEVEKTTEIGNVLHQEEAISIDARVEKTDALELQSVYIILKNMSGVYSIGRRSRASLKAFFDVVHHVFEKLEKEVPDDIIALVKEVEANAPYNILPLNSAGESTCIMQLEEIKAAVSAARNTHGLKWPPSVDQHQQMDLLDWLRAMFGFQAYNVRNQREDLILQLAHPQARLMPKPEPSNKYKFIVDGEWRHDEHQPFVIGNYGTVNTVFLTREPDYNPAVLSPHINSGSSMDVDNEAFQRVYDSDIIQLYVRSLKLRNFQGISTAPLWDFSKGQFVGVCDSTYQNIVPGTAKEELETHTTSAWKEAKLYLLKQSTEHDENLEDITLKILQNRVATLPITHSTSNDGSYPPLLYLASISEVLKLVCRYFRHSASSLPILQLPICSLSLGTWVPKIEESNRQPLAILRPNSPLSAALNLFVQGIESCDKDIQGSQDNSGRIYEERNGESMLWPDVVMIGHRSNNYSESKRNDHLDNNRRQEQRNKGIPNKSHPNFREEHKSFSSIFVSNIPWNASVQDLWDLVTNVFYSDAKAVGQQISGHVGKSVTIICVTRICGWCRIAINWYITSKTYVFEGFDDAGLSYVWGRNGFGWSSDLHGSSGKHLVGSSLASGAPEGFRLGGRWRSALVYGLVVMVQCSHGKVNGGRGSSLDESLENEEHLDVVVSVGCSGVECDLVDSFDRSELSDEFGLGDLWYCFTDDNEAVSPVSAPE
ncbi:sucrose nonfermenting 4-like protein [Tanacetum coccineum]